MSNNPTYREFLNAKASKKPEMIMEGFDRMIHDLNEASANLKVLNGWIGSLPGLFQGGHTKLPEAGEFQLQFERYVRATDNLTAQIVMNAEKIRDLMPLYKQNI